MSILSTISVNILLALILLLAVFMGSFHLWSIVVTIKETITDVRKRYIGLSVLERKKFLLRGLLALVVLVILFAFLWMHGHNLI
jgi:hypothetical protein